MHCCYALGCDHSASKGNCTFYGFPADPELFEEWKSLCPRKEKEPTIEDRLCSCHFIDGDRINKPTVFAHSNASLEFSASSEANTNESNDATLINTKNSQNNAILREEWECRACLEKIGCKASLVNIFEAWKTPWEGMQSTIAEDLAKIGHIKLSPSDEYPKYICETCCAKLQNACNFAAVVQHSDTILKQRYPQKDIDTNDGTVWPKPIQLDKNIDGTFYQTPMDIEIKQEVLSDSDDGENANGSSEAQYTEFADNVEIKIEPEEIIRPIQINGTFSYKEGTDNSAYQNGNDMLVEFLDTPLKEEPTSEVDSDVGLNDLPLECLLCSKSFHSLSGLKAHVIAQHSYKTVKRKLDDSQSAPVKKDKYVCATCRRSFVTSTDLMVHETCHNKATCYACNQKFDTFEQLSKHRVSCKAVTSKDLPKPKTLQDVKRMIAEERKSIDDEDLPKEQLQCHLCTEKFSDAYYMKIHQEIHHSGGEQPVAPPPATAALETAALESIFTEDK